MQTYILLLLENNSRLLHEIDTFSCSISEYFKQKFTAFRNRTWEVSPFKLDDYEYIPAFHLMKVFPNCMASRYSLMHQ
jgi:hypothetical protein